MEKSNKSYESIKKEIISRYAAYMRLSGKKPDLKKFKEKLDNPENMNAVIEFYEHNIQLYKKEFTHSYTKRK